ncbi:MAG: thiolase family protein [Planctomycetes bacterium]|nr:thiolase family protein [Planctomycetota bacterium]
MPAPRVPIVIAAGLRTPQARAAGAFAQEDAAHLASSVTRELLARTGIDPASVDELVAGCAGPPHDQANVGRVLALRAGLPRQVPARTVARNCASGMEAVTSAIAEIEAGHGELYLAVGVEVMSRFPLIVSETMTRLFAGLAAAKSAPQRLGVLAGFRPAMLKPRVAIMEGLTDPISGLIMGKTAELLAREWNVTREDADRFALESHQRAARARDQGKLAREIVPHLPLGARSGARALEHDDGIRDAQTMEGLAKLKPYFEKPDGRVTVGNSCGLTDAACALVVTTEARAKALGLAPLARVRSWAWAGCDPARMGLGPVYATAKALDAAKLTVADLGAIELNEAFAAQVLACQKAFDSDAFAKNELGRAAKLGAIDPAKLNPNGGAIALGHPVGCTGARILLTAAHELARGDHEFTLATLCIGGGQGGAVILERVSA